MNEFKFACPNCKRSIQATPEYSGVQITCPNCQASIVVPDAPGVPAPKGSKLTMAPSTVEHIVTTPTMAAHMVQNKKKFPIGKYLSWAGWAVGIILAIILVPKALDKYHQHQEEVKAAQEAAQKAAELAANPPPPPELNADEIVKKLGATYKALPNLTLQGVSVGDIDYSAISPANKVPVETITKLSIRLGRNPDFYRLEWARQVGGRDFTGAVWNSGKGDIVRTGNAAAVVKTRERALNGFAGASTTMGVYIANLFFDETNSIATAMKNFAKTNTETLDNQKCYVLTGRLASQNLIFWIRQSDFMIVQAELVLGGEPDAADLNGLSLAQKAIMERAAKLRGSYLEDYSSIATSKTPLTARDFESSFPPNANPTARQLNRPKSGT